MISHWEPPGSYPGRPFYSWYLTFNGARELHDRVGRYAVALRPFAVDIVPPEGLHLTLQNVGYIDDVDTAAIQRIAAVAAASCERVAPFEVDIDRAVVHPEAVLLLVVPREPVDYVRKVVRQAIIAVMGSDQSTEGAQADASPDSFIPHITVAYSRSNGAAAPLIAAVQAVGRNPVHVAIDAADLLAVHRAGPAYQWTYVSTARLRGAPSHQGQSQPHGFGGPS